MQWNTLILYNADHNLHASVIFVLTISTYILHYTEKLKFTQTLLSVFYIDQFLCDTSFKQSIFSTQGQTIRAMHSLCLNQFSPPPITNI